MANHYDHAHGRLETEYTFVRQGVVEKRSGTQRVYTYSELARLLNEAGFEKVEGFAGPDREPFRLGAARLCLTAVRA